MKSNKLYYYYIRSIFLTSILLLISFSSNLKALNNLPAKKVIRLASTAPDKTPWHNVYLEMQDYLKKASKNKINLNLITKGIKGGELTVFKNCIEGKLDAAGGSMGALAKFVPELGVFELPYLFENDQEIDHIFKELGKSYLNKILSSHNIQLFYLTEVGWRGFASKNKPILNPDDLKGLKFRSQQSPLHLYMWKLAKLKAVPLSVTDTLKPLKKGLIQAFDNSLIFMYAAGWYKYMKYVTESNHIYQPAIVIYSDKLKQMLTPAEFELFTKNSILWANKMTTGVRGLRSYIKQSLIKNGIIVNNLTNEQKKSFIKLFKPAWMYWLKNSSPAGRELFIRIDNSLKKLRKSTKLN